MNPIKKEPVFVFVDESGVAEGSSDRQPFFAIGFLVIHADNIDALQSALNSHIYQYHAELRQQRKSFINKYLQNPGNLTKNEINLLNSLRHYEFHHVDIRDSNVTKYIKFIDTAYEHIFEFTVFMVDKKAPWFNKEIHGNYYAAYCRSLNMLTEHYIKDNQIAVMIADEFNRPTGSNSLQQELNSNKIPFITHTSSRHYVLLQLCDLLLGSILHIRKTQKARDENKFKPSKRSKAKLRFSQCVTDKFEKLHSGRNQLSKNKKWQLNVWDFKPHTIPPTEEEIIAIFKDLDKEKNKGDA